MKYEVEPSARHAVLVFVDEMPRDLQKLPLVAGLLKHWVLILISGLAFSAAALSYSLMVPKWYRAQALISPVPEDMSATGTSLGGDISGLASLVGINVGSGDTRKNEAIARFSSREFMYGFLQSEEIIPLLFSDRWDAEGQRWDPSKPTPTLDEAYRFFTGRVATLSEDRRTDVLKVTVDWTDPERASEWANRLIAHLNADRRAAARSETDRNLEFLSRELEQASVLDLRQAINRLMENEIRKRMLISVREEFVFKVLDPAVVPSERAVVRPRVLYNTAIGFLLGCLLCLGLVIIYPMFRGLRDSRER